MATFVQEKLSIDKLLEVIARDCIENNQRWVNPEEEHYLQEFSVEQNAKYKQLAPTNQFWGGYAYLDENAAGIIRLYSPQGSAKWIFTLKNEELDIQFA